ncbi:MAG TPA: hypothetical protein VJ734_02490, partial [Nitrosospira sp.]|nr:hypothetical protein [Nitrosospira sp.]
MRSMKGLEFFSLYRLAALAVLSVLAVNGQAVASTAVGDRSDVHYDIHVQIDPVARSIKGRSVITANTPEELTLVIGRRFEVMHARVDDDPIGPAAVMGHLRGWRISSDEKMPRRIEMHSQGEFSALDTSLDHRQTLGRNEPVSGEAGTFLPDSSGWYPYLAGKLASYQLSIEL